MADSQPPNVVEGATTGDIDEEVPVAAKSAEDRKAAAALSSLDAPRDDDSSATKDVDREAVRKAMDRLAGSGTANGTAAKKEDEKQAPKKLIKVDQADVTLLVCPLPFHQLRPVMLGKSPPPAVLQATPLPLLPPTLRRDGVSCTESTPQPWYGPR